MANRVEVNWSFFEVVFNVVFPFFIIALGVVGFLTLKALRKPIVRETPQTPLPLVRTARVERHQGGLELKTDGVVVPYREIQIAAEVDGRIVEKTPECDAGKYVSQGALLLVIDKSEYQIEYARLQEQLKQAEASLSELDVEIANTERLLEIARQQFALQKQDFNRAERLYGSNTITQADFDAARKSLLLAEQEFTNLENQLRLKRSSRERLMAVRNQTEVALKKATLDLSRTEIRAPSDGVVISDLVEENSYVRKGTVVVVFEDTSMAQVKCNLTTRQIAWIWALIHGKPFEEEKRSSEAYQIPRLPVSVEYDLDGQVFFWTGILDGYEGLGVDERTRMVSCRVLVEQPTLVSPKTTGEKSNQALVDLPKRPPALVRGMYVIVRIHIDPGSIVLRIPERAVQPGGMVGRIRDGKLKMVPVELAEVVPEKALVVAPPEILREGDAVAVSPTPFIENNPLAISGDGLPVEEQPIL
ncbi:MAG: efflux RND transporter periplasmic adaptor subunit [Thermogutta sp.]